MIQANSIRQTHLRNLCSARVGLGGIPSYQNRGVVDLSAFPPYVVAFLLQAVAQWQSALDKCKAVWKELRGVPLLPLANGTAGSFPSSTFMLGGGKKYVLATRRQQGLLPQLKDRFVHLKATRRLARFFEHDSFLEVCTLTVPLTWCWREHDEVDETPSYGRCTAASNATLCPVGELRCHTRVLFVGYKRSTTPRLRFGFVSFALEWSKLPEKS